MWIKKDPLRTYEDIADGPATLTILGELEGVPKEWENIYNIKQAREHAKIGSIKNGKQQSSITSK